MTKTHGASSSTFVFGIGGLKTKAKSSSVWSCTAEPLLELPGIAALDLVTEQAKEKLLGGEAIVSGLGFGSSVPVDCLRLVKSPNHWLRGTQEMPAPLPAP